MLRQYVKYVFFTCHRLFLLDLLSSQVRFFQYIHRHVGDSPFSWLNLCPNFHVNHM